MKAYMGTFRIHHKLRILLQESEAELKSYFFKWHCQDGEDLMIGILIFMSGIFSVVTAVYAAG